MTDSIFHGLAIGLSLLASCPPGTRVSTMDFGRSMAYLGRAGWDNENTLEIQGERHLLLLQDMELIDGDHRLTSTGEQRPHRADPADPHVADRHRRPAQPRRPGRGPRGGRAGMGGARAGTGGPAEPEVEPDVPDQENGYHEVGLGAPSRPRRSSPAPTFLRRRGLDRSS